MIGLRIKDLRKSKDITRKELAEFLQVSVGAISHWESNYREPDINTINKIANYFNVSIDYLINGATNNKEITIIGRNGFTKKYNLNDKQLNSILDLANLLDTKQNDLE